MTVKQAVKELRKLMKGGCGNHKVGYFSHHTGKFIEVEGFEPTKNGGYYEEPGTEKTEEVIQGYHLGGQPK